jgi:hypothetical protein
VTIHITTTNNTNGALNGNNTSGSTAESSGSSGGGLVGMMGSTLGRLWRGSSSDKSNVNATTGVQSTSANDDTTKQNPAASVSSFASLRGSSTNLSNPNGTQTTLASVYGVTSKNPSNLTIAKNGIVGRGVISDVKVWTEESIGVVGDRWCHVKFFSAGSQSVNGGVRLRCVGTWIPFLKEVDVG